MNKRTKRIGIVALIAIIIAFITCLKPSEIKTIKSEKELLRIAENNSYKESSFITKMLTLPISLIFGNNYYSGIYTTGYDDYTNNSWDNSWESIDSYKGDSISENDDYSKTNVQVEGVDEADITKTDGNYIYSISGSNVFITNAADPNNIKLEGLITSINIPEDLIIYQDKLVIVYYQEESVDYDSYSSRTYINTIVSIYDIKDKGNPKLLKEVNLPEPYYTTRCIDGRLFVFSSGNLRTEDNKVLRSYTEDKTQKEISLNKIKYLKESPTNTQTLIAEVDLNNITDVDISSYLIDITNAYISEKSIYLLNDYYSYRDNLKFKDIFGWKGIFGIINTDSNNDYETEIVKFNINTQKGISYQTSTKLEGETINQYSLDENNKKLRVAMHSDNGTRVVVLDKNLNTIGETENVAKGEEMYASRFIGDKAYLVTYKNTDPLFVIDLSDSHNPKVLGELKIPGYSTYLHPYDETHLIGIGMDTEEEVERDTDGSVLWTSARITGMKMSLFDVSDIYNPKQIATTKIGDSSTVSAVLTNPKALLFSKEKNLLAIPVNHYEEEFSSDSSKEIDEEIEDFIYNSKDYISEGYFVYNIDLDKGFELKGTITHNKTTSRTYGIESKLLRGLYIKDDLYTVSEDEIQVHSISDLTEKSRLDINKEGELLYASKASRQR